MFKCYRHNAKIVEENSNENFINIKCRKKRKAKQFCEYIDIEIYSAVAIHAWIGCHWMMNPRLGDYKCAVCSCVCVCRRVKVQQQQQQNMLMNSQVAFLQGKVCFIIFPIFSLKLQSVKFHLYAMLQLLFNLHACSVREYVCACVCLLSLGVWLQNEFYFNLCADRGTKPDQTRDGRGLGHFSPTLTYRLIDTHTHAHTHTLLAAHTQLLENGNGNMRNFSTRQCLPVWE